MHRLALVLALALAAPAQAASPFGAADIAFVEGDQTMETVPRVGAPAFPLDASPVIRIGDGVRMFMDERLEPTLFHLPEGEDPVRVPFTGETRTFGLRFGAVDWIRMTPDDLLVEGERYQLAFALPEEVGEEDPEDREFFSEFSPVTFTAGPPEESAPVAPEHGVRVTDHGLRPGGPFRQASHEHSTQVDIEVASADFGPHDTWMFFEVEEGFEGDLEDLGPQRWVTPDALTADVIEVASWRYPRPADGRRCVVAATEDAYGAVDASDAVCADPVHEACDGCSSAGPSRGGFLALLGVVGAIASRRRLR